MHQLKMNKNGISRYRLEPNSKDTVYHIPATGDIISKDKNVTSGVTSLGYKV
jgi:hypothetical protein